MEMTTVKSLVVLAIIFGCFAVLYPKIFHPMLMHAFGPGEQHMRDDDLPGGKLPPHLRKPGPSTTKQMPAGMDDISRHMKAGPHPGLRAAAEMKKQAAQTQGGSGGKGMMSVVLPMYAVGIVIYLIYTMTKVFGRKDKKEEGRDYLSSHFSDLHYDADRQKFTRRGAKDSDDDDEEDEMVTRKKSRKKQRDLERLLLKADRDKISEMEVTELKRRLLETEEQMTRILQAMESVTQQVDDVGEAATAAAKQPDTKPDKQPDTPLDEDTVYVKSVASSPDTESYEFLNGQTPEKEELEELPQDDPMADSKVESLGPESQDSGKTVAVNDSERVHNTTGDYEDDFEDYEEGETEEEAIEEDIVIEEEEDSSADHAHPDLRKRLPRSTDEDGTEEGEK